MSLRVDGQEQAELTGPCDEESRGWMYAAAGPKISRSSKPREAKRRQGRSLPSRLQREHGPADALITDFQPLEM